MTDQRQPTGSVTRHLNMDSVSPTAPRRGTGPLDYAVPWVVEFRVVGTADVLQVQLRPSMMVGRSDEHKKVTPDIDLGAYNGYYMGVSREHAVLSALNSRLALRDLGSSNGTFINGMRLDPGKEYQVRHGDLVGFGKLALQVAFVLTPSSHEKNQTNFADVTIPKVGSGQRVLIVDDDTYVAGTMGDVLRQAGFSVMMVGEVTAAFTLMNAQMPHVVITELILPDRSGLEIVKYVRGNHAEKGIPVIVVSSATGGYQMGQAMEAGADVFLTKPVGVDELIRGMNKILTQVSM